MLKRTYIFLLVVLFLGSFVFVKARGILKVSFLDVGQGDAIYIEAPNGNQMIIDGGPPGSLEAPLSEVMPFGDRSVNLIMITNPDADHYAGFINLLNDYKVGAVIVPGTLAGGKTFGDLQKEINYKNIPEVLARRGMTIDIDKENGVTFTILFPDRDVSGWTSNDGSIEGILRYGKNKIMFTGDGTKKTEEVILSENTSEILHSDILKVAHHGSATSSEESFISAVAPAWAVISAGYHNKYGLPKQVTLDMLAKHSAQILRTDELGTVTFISDGNSYSQAK